MTLRTISLVAAVALTPAAALAQSDMYASPAYPAYRATALAAQPNIDHAAAGTAARDGCINVPGEAHNSADCARISASDTNTAINRDEMAGDRVSGATENAARNARILSGQSSN